MLATTATTALAFAGNELPTLHNENCEPNFEYYPQDNQNLSSIINSNSQNIEPANKEIQNGTNTENNDSMNLNTLNLSPSLSLLDVEEISRLNNFSDILPGYQQP